MISNTDSFHMGDYYHVDSIHANSMEIILLTLCLCGKSTYQQYCFSVWWSHFTGSFTTQRVKNTDRFLMGYHPHVVATHANTLERTLLLFCVDNPHHQHYWPCGKSIWQVASPHRRSAMLIDIPWKIPLMLDPDILVPWGKQTHILAKTTLTRMYTHILSIMWWT